MIEYEYLTDHRLGYAFHDGEKFWVVTQHLDQQNFTATTIPTVIRHEFRSSVRVYSTEMILLLNHPKCPGLSVVDPNHTGPTKGFCLADAKEFVVTEEPAPVLLVSGTGLSAEWFNKHLEPYRITPVGLPSRVRLAATDKFVVMTGSEAIKHGTAIMGPTVAKGVLSVKGLRQGHLVFYRRGGTARVVATKGSVIHMEISPDDLTVLVAHYDKVQLWDIDVE